MTKINGIKWKFLLRYKNRMIIFPVAMTINAVLFPRSGQLTEKGNIVKFRIKISNRFKVKIEESQSFEIAAIRTKRSNNTSKTFAGKGRNDTKMSL